MSARSYRTFWPLRQVGDPLDDRMFDVNEHSVYVILSKLEQRYGKYAPASSTDRSTNTFQQLDFFKRPLTRPVWSKDTKAPRAHAEAILRKYGVPYLPSHSPGIRMVDFFRDRFLISNPETATPEDRSYDGAFALGVRESFTLSLRAAAAPTRIGASPNSRGPPSPPSGRSVGGRQQLAASRSPSPRLSAGSPLTLPPLKHGSISQGEVGSPQSVMYREVSPRRLF